MNYQSDSDSYVEGLNTRDYLFYKQKEREIQMLGYIAKELSELNRFYRNINKAPADLNNESEREIWE